MKYKEITRKQLPVEIYNMFIGSYYSEVAPIGFPYDYACYVGPIVHGKNTYWSFGMPRGEDFQGRDLITWWVLEGRVISNLPTDPI